MLYRVLAILFGAAALAGCGDRSVTCGEYTTDAGSRPSLTTFPRAVNSHAWSKCSDGKTRTVTCTPGHLSAWKCTCAVDGVDKIESRRETDVPEERGVATSEANQMCHWKLQ
jgi:hypothetical protein